jgi:hypothetical protein
MKPFCQANSLYDADSGPCWNEAVGRNDKRHPRLCQAHRDQYDEDEGIFIWPGGQPTTCAKCPEASHVLVRILNKDRSGYSMWLCKKCWAEVDKAVSR